MMFLLLEEQFLVKLKNLNEQKRIKRKHLFIKNRILTELIRKGEINNKIKPSLKYIDKFRSKKYILRRFYKILNNKKTFYKIINKNT